MQFGSCVDNAPMLIRPDTSACHRRSIRGKVAPMNSKPPTWLLLGAPPMNLTGNSFTLARVAEQQLRHAVRRLCWPGSIRSPSETLHDFRQEPRPPLGLVNPDLDQTGGRPVILFFARFMCRTEITRQRLIICVELCEHYFWGDALIVVVLHAFMPWDIADRAQRCSFDFSGTLRNF